MKIIFVFIGVGLTMLALGIWGAVIAFQSHVLTGVIVLVIEPLPVVVGVLDGVFNVGVADSITDVIEKILD